MKPTNPNADTYVEKRRFNTYLSQFPANPLVEHPDSTHSCGAPLLDTIALRSGKTLLLDTLICLVGHSCLTLFWDTLTWHPCNTLLAWHSYAPLLWDTLTWHSCRTILTWHFLLDTLLGHSYLTLFWDILPWLTLLYDTLTRHSCKTLLWDTLTWHSRKTLWLDTLVRHSYLRLL